MPDIDQPRGDAGEDRENDQQGGVPRLGPGEPEGRNQQNEAQRHRDSLKLAPQYVARSDGSRRHEVHGVLAQNGEPCQNSRQMGQNHDENGRHQKRQGRIVLADPDDDADGGQIEQLQ